MRRPGLLQHDYTGRMVSKRGKKRGSAPGQQLRELREELGLAIGEVQRRTKRRAEVRKSPELMVWKSRLSDIETTGRTPRIYALSALAQTYRIDVRRLFRLYGASPGDGSKQSSRRKHLALLLTATSRTPPWPAGRKNFGIFHECRLLLRSSGGCPRICILRSAPDSTLRRADSPLENCVRADLFHVLNHPAFFFHQRINSSKTTTERPCWERSFGCVSCRSRNKTSAKWFYMASRHSSSQRRFYAKDTLDARYVGMPVCWGGSFSNRR
jgi:transcriptional regulator with XRE-family HTH domain